MTSIAEEPIYADELLMPGTIVAYSHDPRNKLIGVVLCTVFTEEEKVIRTKYSREHLLVEKPYKQYYAKVENMNREREFIRLDKVKVLTKVAAVYAHFTADDLVEITKALGYHHPIASSLRAQTIRAEPNTGANVNVAAARKFLAAMKGIPHPKPPRTREPTNYFN